MLTQAQIEFRESAIGASEVAAAMDLSKYTSRYDLWLVKTGRQKPFEGNAKTEIGNRIEAFIAELYQDRTGRRLRKHNKTLVHPKLPFACCHLDYLILNEPGVCDCKNTEGWGNDWGEEGTDNIPIEYVLQGQQQLAITNRQFVDFPAFMRGWDLKIYTVHRNNELISEIEDGLVEFQGYVERDEAPPPRTAEDIKKRWPNSVANCVIADDALRVTAEKSEALRVQIRDMKADKEALDIAIKKFMAESDTLVDGQNRVLATYKTYSKRQFQEAKLKNDRPKLYESFINDQTYRTLRLKTKNLGDPNEI